MEAVLREESRSKLEAVVRCLVSRFRSQPVSFLHQAALPMPAVHLQAQLTAHKICEGS